MPGWLWVGRARGRGDNVGGIWVPNPSRTHPRNREDETEGKQQWESRRESHSHTPLPCGGYGIWGVGVKRNVLTCYVAVFPRQN